MKLTKDMAAVRAAARSELDAIFAERLNAILGPLAAVRARKADEARRVAAGGSSIMLEAEANAVQIDLSAVVLAILAKSDAEAGKLGAIEADRQAAQAAIDAAANPIAVEAILNQHR